MHTERRQWSQEQALRLGYDGPRWARLLVVGHPSGIHGPTRPIHRPVDFSMTENMAYPFACHEPIAVMIDRQVSVRGIVPPMNRAASGSAIIAAHASRSSRRGGRRMRRDVSNRRSVTVEEAMGDGFTLSGGRQRRAPITSRSAPEGRLLEARDQDDRPRPRRLPPELARRRLDLPRR